MAARWTILVAEDHDEVRMVVGAALGRAGHEVLEATSGTAALELARGHPGPIHLVVADVVMPQMTGPQLFSQLLRSRPGLKAVLMSGYGPPQEGAAAAGAVFMAKPFTAAQLLATVEAAMARPRA